MVSVTCFQRIVRIRQRIACALKTRLVILVFLVLMLRAACLITGMMKPIALQERFVMMAGVLVQRIVRYQLIVSVQGILIVRLLMLMLIIGVV